MIDCILTKLLNPFEVFFDEEPRSKLCTVKKLRLIFFVSDYS